MRPGAGQFTRAVEIEADCADRFGRAVAGDGAGEKRALLPVMRTHPADIGNVIGE
jgi:hypothetical protein